METAGRSLRKLDMLIEHARGMRGQAAASHSFGSMQASGACGDRAVRWRSPQKVHGRIGSSIRRIEQGCQWYRVLVEAALAVRAFASEGITVIRSPLAMLSG